LPEKNTDELSGGELQKVAIVARFSGDTEHLFA